MGYNRSGQRRKEKMRRRRREQERLDRKLAGANEGPKKEASASIAIASKNAQPVI
jgi:hypothetical protein